MGVELRIIITRDAPTQEDWRAESDSLGDMSLLRPSDVESALTSEAASKFLPTGGQIIPSRRVLTSRQMSLPHKVDILDVEQSFERHRAR